MAAWNGWYHLMANTYGTWLPGDKRGFRTRHHREHVEGDYKNPPPEGMYVSRQERARRLMKREAVILLVNVREPALRAILHALRTVHRLEMLAISVSGMHLHVLVRLPVGQKPTAFRRGLREKDPARYYIGIAKERSAKALAGEGWVAPRGVWARRGKVKPVGDREHQVNVFNYILDHFAEGAAVRCFREPDVIRMSRPKA